MYMLDYIYLELLDSGNDRTVHDLYELECVLGRVKVAGDHAMTLACPRKGNWGIKVLSNSPKRS